MVNKILGYILLAAGTVIIFGALWQSYNIFTGKASAPLVFTTPTVQKNASADKSQTLQEQMQQLLGQATQQQVNQIIAPDAITKILNLLSWSLLAAILILGGGAIAGIGVKLVK